jgi:hypothetical protein
MQAFGVRFTVTYRWPEERAPRAAINHGVPCFVVSTPQGFRHFQGGRRVRFRPSAPRGRSQTGERSMGRRSQPPLTSLDIVPEIVPRTPVANVPDAGPVYRGPRQVAARPTAR